ncbi:hypothetical protein [Citrobacter phage Tr1]|nr:hypothetical protein [Citrobacter phage Tr1]
MLNILRIFTPRKYIFCYHCKANNSRYSLPLLPRKIISCLIISYVMISLVIVLRATINSETMIYSLVS